MLATCSYGWKTLVFSPAIGLLSSRPLQWGYPKAQETIIQYSQVILPNSSFENSGQNVEENALQQVAI
jgi:hypothetical protein